MVPNKSTEEPEDDGALDHATTPVSLGESGPQDRGYVVDCDFNGIWAWHFRPDRPEYEGTPCGEGNFWFGDREIPQDLITAFNAWQDRFEFGPLDDIPPGADGIEGFSWQAFHADGLVLAKRLKAFLGADCVVIYSKPFEDRSFLGQVDLLITDELEQMPYVHAGRGL